MAASFGKTFLLGRRRCGAQLVASDSLRLLLLLLRCPLHVRHLPSVELARRPVEEASIAAEPAGSRRIRRRGRCDEWPPSAFTPLCFADGSAGVK